MSPSLLETNSLGAGSRVTEVYVHDTYVKVAGIQVWPPSAIWISVGALVVIAFAAALVAVVWRQLLVAGPSLPEGPHADSGHAESRDRH